MQNKFCFEQIFNNKGLTNLKQNDEIRFSAGQIETKN